MFFYPHKNLTMKRVGNQVDLVFGLNVITIEDIISALDLHDIQ